MAFPRTFGTLTSPVPASYLDDNFASLLDSADATEGDNNVAVLRSFTGAAACTQHDMNARAAYTFEDAGAVGNDSTVDRANMQEVIDAVAAAGGGWVHGTPGKVYKIDTSPLLLKTGVRINLNGAKIKQYTSNVPILSAPNAAEITEWGLCNGRLEFPTQQTNAQTSGVGVRLADGSNSYIWFIENVTCIGACDGIMSPSSASSFAFIGRIKNFMGFSCATWAINMDCPTGAYTNIDVTNAWSVQNAGTPITGSKGFRFKNGAMLNLNSLFADHIRGQFLQVENCNGRIGEITCEAAVISKSSGQETMVVLADSPMGIDTLNFAGNSWTTSGSGEIYLLRPTSSGADFAVTVTNYISGGNSYSGSAIYEAVPTTGIRLYNVCAKLDRTANLSDSGTNKLIRLWNGVNRDVGKGTTANRPTPTADDIGRLYMDTTLDADGKPIFWNGSAWVDATGATV